MDEQRVVVRRSVAEPAPGSVEDRSVVEETVRRSPSAAEMARRVVVFAFGIVQLVIVLRIVLLALGADRANALVRAIFDLSGALISPFEGILRTQAVAANGSVLDVTAIVALVGWTILELLVIAAIGIVRREP